MQCEDVEWIRVAQNSLAGTCEWGTESFGCIKGGLFFAERHSASQGLRSMAFVSVLHPVGL
jgi:hypothetical protein